MLRKFLGENSISKCNFLTITILFVSIFGWYYMTLPMFNNMLTGLDNTQSLIIWATFYLSIIATALLGTFLSNRFDRVKFISIWSIISAIASLLPMLITLGNFSQVWMVSFLLGATFGVGVPSCLAYFAESTVVENRGRVGGITFLIANFSTIFLAIMVNNVDFVIITIVFAALRIMGLVILWLKPENQEVSKKKSEVTFVSIFKDRTFRLYFLAWSMFPLVDSFERVLVDNHLNSTLLENMGMVETLVAAVSILVAGLLCDWIGRKKIILSGFVALGIAYALIGFFPDIEPVWYLYFIVDGFAWGVFLLIFLVILWGDIAQINKSEKFYTLGSIPYFLSSIIPPLLTHISISEIDVHTAFSVAAFFLFVAIMPLVFAPETLPEKKMELRRLRSFAEEAQKAKEIYERKMKK